MLRNHLLQAAFVQRSKMLSFPTSSSKHACVSALLRFEHPVLVTSTAASTDVHRYTSLSRNRGVTQSSLSPFVPGTLQCIRRAVDYCRQQSSTFLYSSATTPHPQIILPMCFYRSTLLYTHNHARLTRKGISRVCPAALLVEIVLCRFISKTRRNFYYSINRSHSRMERMSDARYTALLVARGDDDEVRHKDPAPSKNNSTAYSSGRRKPACSTCGETTQNRPSPQRGDSRTNWPDELLVKKVDRRHTTPT